MPTIKEKMEEEFTGKRLSDEGLYSDEFNAFWDAKDKIAMSPQGTAYTQAYKSKNELNSKLLHAKCDRDKLNRVVAYLEKELAAAEFAVKVIGDTEVPQ